VAKMMSPGTVGRLAWCAAALLLLPRQVTCSESVVIPLTQANFNDAIKEHPLILVEFYAPWCGHCKQMEPEYKKAARHLNGRVAFANVDATAEVTLAEQFKVEGYPTLYFFNRGQPEEYSGGRSNASIVQWVEEHSGPALVDLASESALKEALALRKTLPFIAAFGGEPLKKIMGKIAEDKRTLGSYYYVKSEDPPKVQLHRGIGEVVEMTDNLGDAAEIEAFLQREKLPAFGEIDEENYAGYLEKADKGMLWVCFNPETFKTDAMRHRAVFSKVAEEFPQFPAVYTDSKVYEEHVKEELGCTSFPMVVLQIGNFTNEEEEPKRYKLTGKTPATFTAAEVSQWIKEVLDGKVTEDDGLEELDNADMEDDEEPVEEAGPAPAPPPPTTTQPPPPPPPQQQQQQQQQPPSIPEGSHGSGAPSDAGAANSGSGGDAPANGGVGGQKGEL